ncbi:histone lysine demethylase JMJD5 [Cardiosporidium cionae]|uniref:Histone lysine demethylase JMJD5 n=1 Tax=Cardiosporidium cionae TaxID=476202 RepID=A0ABQ7J8S8_9APIC|nr:histone lysine demethylase JMJD5 [Cardiosporidium cionae]|eukprot:KAF8820404.1 histone lysine demethylase JMJD5 [Cardiosporidium cionae]
MHFPDFDQQGAAVAIDDASVKSGDSVLRMDGMHPLCVSLHSDGFFVQKGFVLSVSLPETLREKMKTLEIADSGLDPSLEEARNEILEAFSVFISVNNSYRMNVNPASGKVSPSLETFLNALQTLKFFCDEFFSICSERLHSGPWYSVSLLWRMLYTFTTFLESLLFLLCISIPPESPFYDINCQPLFPEMVDNASNLHQAYYFADMGLIMGGSENPLSSFLFGILDVLKKVDFSVINLQKYTFKNLSKTPSSKRIKHEWNSSSILYKSSNLEAPSKDFLRWTTDQFSFQDQFYLPQQPALLLEAMHSSPAFHKWNNFDYFRQVAGRRTIPIEIGKLYTEEGWTQKLMTLNEFLDRYVENDAAEEVAYLAQHPIFQQIPQLAEDIIPPDFIYCGLEDMENPLQLLWLGPKGTISPLHTDHYDNIFAQIVGVKYLRLYPPNASESIYPYKEGPLTNTSQIQWDLHALDTKAYTSIESKFPNFLKAGFFEVILTAGDALYIPKGWWHFVKSLSPSASVSFWF